MNGRYAIPPDIEAIICAFALEHPVWSIRRIHKALRDSGVPISYPTVWKLLKKNRISIASAREDRDMVMERDEGKAS